MWSQCPGNLRTRDEQRLLLLQTTLRGPDFADMYKPIRLLRRVVGSGRKLRRELAYGQHCKSTLLCLGGFVDAELPHILLQHLPAGEGRECVANDIAVVQLGAACSDSYLLAGHVASAIRVLTLRGSHAFVRACFASYPPHVPSPLHKTRPSCPGKPLNRHP